MKYSQNILNCIVNFLNSINIKIVEEKLPNNTFLPGISIKGNIILMDPEKLKYPGDLLHEAGHIAVTEEKIRPFIGTDKIGSNWPTDGDEIAAILWSYAASHHLNLNLEVVFHPNGYKNDSKWLIAQFSNKNYLGLPLLEWMSLCDKDEFPKMKKWLR
ncbi:hypothetical protein BX611_2996 [Lutibacter oceani]|uniref:IrrE N-terminal-like domain-containing protein n=1 Tax=Lutibacter oceani TaxID=1853311 RepID=A0A3D9RIF3_9FLAO|nr:hypothetical protein [Lutibacter oceani]REE78859.1 hypothetical protein BX611_2996 [Lutibacter oceani]